METNKHLLEYTREPRAKFKMRLEIQLNADKWKRLTGWFWTIRQQKDYQKQMHRRFCGSMNKIYIPTWALYHAPDHLAKV